MGGGFLAPLVLAIIVLGAIGVHRFVFGIDRAEKLKDRNRFLWVLSLIPCGILGFVLMMGLVFFESALHG